MKYVLFAEEAVTVSVWQKALNLHHNFNALQMALFIKTSTRTYYKL
jgi:hypothetical protein